MIQDMKCYHEGELYDVIGANLISFSTGDEWQIDIHNGKDKYETNIKDIIELPCFPDTDKEGKKCWSGDLLTDFANEEDYLLVYGKYCWALYDLTQDKIGHCTTLEVLKTCKLERICSALEPEALNYIDKETQQQITQLIER